MMSANANDYFSKSTLNALEAALKEANGRATARTLDVDGIVEYLHSYMLRLDISKKALTGTEVTVHASMEQLPRAYKWNADSTKASFLFDGKKWKFLTAERSRLVQRCGSYHVVATLSQTAIEAITSKVSQM